MIHVRAQPLATRAQGDEAPSPAAVPTSSPRTRLGQALTCPFCRDSITRRGTVACARRACGALYHRECWEECVASYGGCAIYGCESKRAKEVSLAGYFFKILRLALAALLFSRRLVRALRSEERSGERESIWTLSWEFASLLDPRTAEGGYAVLCFALYLCALPAVMGAAMFASMLARETFADSGTTILAVVTVYALSVFGAISAPVPMGFMLAAGFYFMKFVALVLRSEVSALARADSPDGTVLGRLRSGADCLKK